ncbi:MAG: ABC transporter ATP-binding protein [Myxococcales bacterium]|nr:MAG: ABC transporter ATP-binding protein [Myxococcales bacterium]
MSQETPMIELVGVRKVYRAGGKDREVLRGVDAAIGRGEFAAVFGRSGAGKSTLLNLIGGLDRDYQGSIRLDGQALETLSDRRLTALRGATAGFVFQNPVFLDHLPAWKNIAFAARFAGGPADRPSLLPLLARLGLEEYADARPNELSGGQQQRLAVARALAGKPKVLLCDEPTGNLDTETGSSLIQILRDLNIAGMTLVVVTHDERVAEAAGRFMYLSDGRLAEGGAS